MIATEDTEFYFRHRLTQKNTDKKISENQCESVSKIFFVFSVNSVAKNK